MRKTLYYTLSFVWVPIMLLADFVEDFRLIDTSAYFNYTAFIPIILLSCIFVGTFSSAKKTFDFIMPLIMSATFFCLMFIAGGFRDGCSGMVEFSLKSAFFTVTQTTCLILYPTMALIAFLASFKPIRISRFLKVNK